VNQGSWNEDDPDRPRWGTRTRLVAEYDYHRADGSYSYTVVKGINSDRQKVFTIRRRNMLSFSDMFEPEDKVDWFYGLGEEKPVLFRLPELIAAATANPGCQVLIPEGEKDVTTLVNLGYVATCNPMGALKWRDEYSKYLKGCDVVVIEDNDERGKEHAFQVAASVRPHARRARILSMPAGYKDITAWVEAQERETTT
jgi:putative DNA primase/helicase